MRIRTILTAVLCFVSLGLNAQTLERSVVSNAGQELTSSSLNLEFTVGELVVGQLKQGSLDLSQGFNQAVAKKSGNVSNIDLIQFQIYPNPASTTVTFQAKESGSVQVVTSTGQVIIEVDVNDGIDNNIYDFICQFSGDS